MLDLFRRRRDRRDRIYRLSCAISLDDVLRAAAARVKTKRRFRIRQDGWVRHDGGACPVPSDTRVQCWFRGSSTPPFYEEAAGKVPEKWWRHDDGRWDVIWFRPIPKWVATDPPVPPRTEIAQ